MEVNSVVPVKNNLFLNHCCIEFVLVNIKICVFYFIFQYCNGTVHRNHPFRFLDDKDPFIHALLIPWLLMFISTCNIDLVLPEYFSYKSVSPTEDAVSCVTKNFVIDMWTMDQVMAWCQPATCYYLIQCWFRSVMSYGVTNPSRITKQTSLHVSLQP